MDAKRTKEAIRIRKKIVSLFSRSQLEKISGMPSPWLANTETLKQTVLTRWPEIAIRDEIAVMLDKT